MHSTMDVIVTAKDIAKAGGILDGVARNIADHCPDSQYQRDIYGYLDQVRLYCHQLNITASVKAKPSPTDTMDTVSQRIHTHSHMHTQLTSNICIQVL